MPAHANRTWPTATPSSVKDGKSPQQGFNKVLRRNLLYIDSTEWADASQFSVFYGSGRVIRVIRVPTEEFVNRLY